MAMVVVHEGKSASPRFVAVDKKGASAKWTNLVARDREACTRV